MPPTRRAPRSAAAIAPYTRADRGSSDSDSPAPVAQPRIARSTRNPRTVIEHSDDDDEMDEVDQPIEAEVDVEGSDDLEDDDLEDAEGEDEEDTDELANHPPPPTIQINSNSKGRPTVTVKPPSEGVLKGVEDKEMEDAEDEDLSDLESEGLGHDIGLDDDEEEPDEEDDDNDDDSDNSGDGTTDLSKLTRRQRGQFEEFDGNLLALSNEAQKKKHISAEEHAMRRAEMARRRKNLSEKRNEEEKIDTINKLLKKPAPKRRTRAEILAAQAAGEGATPGLDGEDGDEIKPDPVYVRWVNSREGSRIGVPDEWLAAPVGRAYAGQSASQPSTSGRARIMVEEVA